MQMRRKRRSSGRKECPSKRQAQRMKQYRSIWSSVVSEARGIGHLAPAQRGSPLLHDLTQTAAGEYGSLMLYTEVKAHNI